VLAGNVHALKGRNYGVATPHVERDEAAPALSPDGCRLAYSFDETGRREVFLRLYPNVQAGHLQVSSGGGAPPPGRRVGTSCSHRVFD
jgi:hypothetical protein